MNIGFLASGRGSNMQSVLDACASATTASLALSSVPGTSTFPTGTSAALRTQIPHVGTVRFVTHWSNIRPIWLCWQDI